MGVILPLIWLDSNKNTADKKQKGKQNGRFLLATCDANFDDILSKMADAIV